MDSAGSTASPALPATMELTAGARAVPTKPREAGALEAMAVQEGMGGTAVRGEMAATLTCRSSARRTLVRHCMVCSDRLSSAKQGTEDLEAPAGAVVEAAAVVQVAAAIRVMSSGTQFRSSISRQESRKN